MHINRINSSTFALSLQPEVVAWHKRLPRPTYEQRLIEILREKASLTREVRFFRTVYQATEAMQYEIRAAVQDATLNYYLRPQADGEADGAWLGLAEQLDAVLLKFSDAVQIAGDEWIELEEVHQGRERHSRI